MNDLKLIVHFKLIFQMLIMFFKIHVCPNGFQFIIKIPTLKLMLLALRYKCQNTIFVHFLKCEIVIFG